MPGDGLDDTLRGPKIHKGHPARAQPAAPLSPQTPYSQLVIPSSQMKETNVKPTVPRVVAVLYNDLVLAHHDLNEYKEVFTNDQSQIDLLNQTGQMFFVRLHHFYWTIFISTVARFLDPPKSFGQENLSFQQLIPLAKGYPFADELSLKLEEAQTSSKHLLQIRHKFIAHRDLKQALLPDDAALRVELATIEEVYSLLGNCLNLFYEHIEKSSSHYTPYLTQSGARSVLSHLRKGRDAFEQVRQEILSRNV